MNEIEENIRTYTFNVPGYIPGVPWPHPWPAGSWATVDETTKTVLDWGPKPIEPEIGEPAPETPPAVVSDSAITLENVGQVASDMLHSVQSE